MFLPALYPKSRTPGVLAVVCKTLIFLFLGLNLGFWDTVVDVDVDVDVVTAGAEDVVVEESWCVEGHSFVAVSTLGGKIADAQVKDFLSKFRSDFCGASKRNAA